MSNYIKQLRTLALAGALSGFAMSGAWADDLVCKKCVDTSDIAKKAITASRIKGGAVKTGKIADGAVTGIKIQDGTVTGADLAPGAVGTGNLAPGAVTGTEIQDGAVGGADIAAGAVGTGHLAADAVTGAEILDGAVGGADIAAGAVGAGHLAADAVTGAAVLDGSVGSAELAAGAVATGNLAADAVTSAEILDGTITAADMGPGAVASTVTLQRTVIVSPSGDGSDATLNGQELLDALTFLGSVTPAPGATNPWLIKIDAGIYDAGATQVQMLSYVDIEGSGVDATTIRGTVNGNITSGGSGGGVVRGASFSVLRNLTVEHTGNSFESAAIQTTAADFTMAQVRAVVKSGSATHVFGVALLAQDITMNSVFVEGGVSNGGIGAGTYLGPLASATLTNVEAESLGATAANNSIGLWSDGNFTARNGVFLGVHFGAQQTSGATSNIATSQVSGGTGDVTVNSGGALVCVGAYDGSFAALNTTCN